MEEKPILEIIEKNRNRIRNNAHFGRPLSDVLDIIEYQHLQIEALSDSILILKSAIMKSLIEIREECLKEHDFTPINNFPVLKKKKDE